MKTTPVAEKADDTWTEADKFWGYKFGCEGIYKHVDAAKFLGISRDTLYRVIRENQVRAGKAGKICVRSVKDYAHKQEA